MGIGQYLSETRTELRHVAWPSRTQTIVYTVLVALISIGVAAYLGFFDFLFTTGLTRLIASLPANTQTTEQSATTTPVVQGNGIQITSTPSDQNGNPIPGTQSTTQTIPVTKTQ